MCDTGSEVLQVRVKPHQTILSVFLTGVALKLYCRASNWVGRVSTDV